MHCIGEINNTQIENAKDLNVVMPMYSLIEYGDNYWKTSGSSWQYYRDKPSTTLTDFESFKSKVKITGSTPADCNTMNVETVVPLKYLRNFWRILEMTLINYKINLIVTWPSTWVITNSASAGIFAITDTKL